VHPPRPIEGTLANAYFQHLPEPLADLHLQWAITLPQIWRGIQSPAMSLTKVAAIITLITALAATGCVLYQLTLVRSKYDAAALNCTECTAIKEAVAANWAVVQDRIAVLQAKGKSREAERFAREHANEKPVNVDVPCSDCEVPAPDYSKSGAVAVVGLVVSALLFGAVKPARR
jgi:hypothetical protein